MSVSQEWDGAHGGWLRVGSCAVDTASEGGPHAQITVEHGMTGPLSACVGAADLAGLTAELYKAAGQPAPLILPRPEVSPEVSANLGSFGVWLTDGGDVVFAFGSSAIDLDADGALKVAALIAAYAGAAKSRKRSPAQELAARMRELSSLGISADAAAERLIADGWGRTLPGEGDGNG